MIPEDQYRRIVLAHLRKISKGEPIRSLRYLARETMKVDIEMERVVWDDMVKGQCWVNRYRFKDVWYATITMEGRKASKFFDRMI